MCFNNQQFILLEEIMGKISKYVDVTSSAFSDNNIKSVALKEFMSENLGKFYLDSLGSDKKQVKEKKEKNKPILMKRKKALPKIQSLKRRCICYKAILALGIISKVIFQY